MLAKCALVFREFNWNQRFGGKNTELSICHRMLTSSTQLQNRPVHAKLLFFIVKYANRPFAANDHVVQIRQAGGQAIIIPALGHQNKGKSKFTGSGLFVLMSQCGNNNELALQHGGFCAT